MLVLNEFRVVTTWFVLRANSAEVAEGWMNKINAAQVCKGEGGVREGRKGGGREREEGGRERGGRGREIAEVAEGWMNKINAAQVCEGRGRCTEGVWGKERGTAREGGRWREMDGKELEGGKNLM